jgi:hypothetical protein
MKKNPNALILLTISGAVMLGACASTQTAAAPTPADVVGGMQSADAKSQECITASIVGGLLGGMMVQGENTAKGAAAGAGIGMLGCVVLKANARDEKQKAEKGNTDLPQSSLPSQAAARPGPLDMKPFD